jgi:hypothetical protein
MGLFAKMRSAQANIREKTCATSRKRSSAFALTLNPFCCGEPETAQLT